MWRPLASSLTTSPVKGWACSAFLHILAIGSLAFVSIGEVEYDEIRFASADTSSITLVLAEFEAEPEFNQSEVVIEVQPLGARIEDRRYSHANTDAPAESIEFESKPTLVATRPPHRVIEQLPEIETPTDLEPPRLREHRRVRQLDARATSLPVAATTLPDFGDNRPPNYPQAAVAQGWEGTVLLRVQLSVAGAVSDVEIIDSSGYAVLDGAAVNAVKTWTASPATRHGVPVETSVRLPVKFRLPKR